MSRSNRVSIDYEFKENDTKPVLSTVFMGHDGLPVDLTNATDVTFRMGHVRDDVLVVASSATIDDATNGLVSYQFSENETAREGLHIAEFVATFPDEDGDGNPETITYPHDEDLGIDIKPGVQRGMTPVALEPGAYQVTSLSADSVDATSATVGGRDVATLDSSGNIDSPVKNTSVQTSSFTSDTVDSTLISTEQGSFNERQWGIGSYYP